MTIHDSQIICSCFSNIFSDIRCCKRRYSHVSSLSTTGRSLLLHRRTLLGAVRSIAVGFTRPVTGMPETCGLVIHAKRLTSGLESDFSHLLLCASVMDDAQLWFKKKKEPGNMVCAPSSTF